MRGLVGFLADALFLGVNVGFGFTGGLVNVCVLLIGARDVLLGLGCTLCGWVRRGGGFVGRRVEFGGVIVCLVA